MTSRNGIREISERVGLSQHTVRYYEKIGLLDPVPRDRAGRRAFGPRDLARLEFLQKLRATGMSIQQMLEYIRLVNVGTDSLSLRRAMLETHSNRVQEQISSLSDCLDVIQKKIELYKEWENEKK